MPDFPTAPRNLFVTTPYIQYVQDIRFDDPSILPENSRFAIIGVNIYRSYDSEYGTYHKINEEPVTTTRYRDELTNTYVANEDATNNFASYADNPRKEYVIQTMNYPILRPGTTPTFIQDDPFTNSPQDVTVKIGDYEIFPLKVDGYNGQIYLPSHKWYDVNDKVWIDPILPEISDYVIQMDDSDLVDEISRTLQRPKMDNNRLILVMIFLRQQMDSVLEAKIQTKLRKKIKYF